MWPPIGRLLTGSLRYFIFIFRPPENVQRPWDLTRRARQDVTSEPPGTRPNFPEQDLRNPHECAGVICDVFRKLEWGRSFVLRQNLTKTAIVLPTRRSDGKISHHLKKIYWPVLTEVRTYGNDDD
jgi:hypothetical protein